MLIGMRCEGQQECAARLANQSVTPIVAVADGVRKSRDAIKSVSAPIAVGIEDARQIAAVQNVERFAVLEHRIRILEKSSGVVCKVRRFRSLTGRFFEREQ